MPSNTISPEQIFSDDSSFYGDDDERGRLEELAASYDPEPFWAEIHPRTLSHVQHTLRTPSLTVKQEPEWVSKLEDEAAPSTILPKSKRGPKESINGFLNRLPPSKIATSVVGPWIWMTKPQSQFSEGDIAAFLRKGTDLLHNYEEESANLRSAHEKSGAKTTAALTRKLNPKRRALEQSILAAARETGVTSGKWMLFPTVDLVDETWRSVVIALDRGDLGEVAKVAADDGAGQARLICVYTEDFSDTEDVKRVLRALVQEGLVNEEGRPIYYKCDAYTHLDIKSDNDYGLKASMFSSRDVLNGKV
ncbi:hypothetical protein N7462_001928 [Penicillium macrosclerotiorum]|uniref:uncharacterized protein n=1 Tax=Penicillium macrosclerotiorum TaxID=303699 RepID=UPI0025496F38|nr:uncharacterized protein N7462_001928 [Penicillium macrosclerotiorum]KAJ5692505.1 hypothetical protein N7462_001928 [Penicillium macrosclerotiorum]